LTTINLNTFTVKLSGPGIGDVQHAGGDILRDRGN
jgi:hypothetical protein